jgi:hypothetical protein
MPTAPPSRSTKTRGLPAMNAKQQFHAKCLLPKSASDVLGRMEEHQHKKTSRLRKLHVSDVNGSLAQPIAASVVEPLNVHS